MKFPNVFRLAGAVLRSIREWADTGSLIVPERIQSDRTGRCEECGYFDPRCRQCRVCTCFVDVKVLLRAESCPRGKWSAWGRSPKRLLDNN